MKTMCWLRCSLVLGLVAPCFAANKMWNDWAFLKGEWVGEGSGQPGEATGGFVFSAGLQDRVLIRKSWAEYPAQNQKPAYRHDDLMIVHQDEGAQVRADYFDNEGHVIRYTVAFAPSHDAVVFTSEPSGAAPQFRLTYTKVSEGHVAIRFEIAPPGKPFSTYLQATAHRK